MTICVLREDAQAFSDDPTHQDSPTFESLHPVGMLYDEAIATERVRPHLVLHARPLAAQDVVLHFELSQNEEHARLRLELDSRHIDLGERVHHYSLATLARLRLRDAQRGLDPCSQGWVSTDDLARMLGIDAAYLNIQVYRARQQFASALAPQLTRLPVERRRGEVRLSQCRFTVRRGAWLEGGSLR